MDTCNTYFFNKLRWSPQNSLQIYHHVTPHTTNVNTHISNENLQCAFFKIANLSNETRNVSRIITWDARIIYYLMSSTRISFAIGWVSEAAANEKQVRIPWELTSASLIACVTDGYSNGQRGQGRRRWAVFGRGYASMLTPDDRPENVLTIKRYLWIAFTFPRLLVGLAAVGGRHLLGIIQDCRRITSKHLYRKWDILQLIVSF